MHTFRTVNWRIVVTVFFQHGKCRLQIGVQIRIFRRIAVNVKNKTVITQTIPQDRQQTIHRTQTIPIQNRGRTAADQRLGVAGSDTACDSKFQFGILFKIRLGSNPVQRKFRGVQFRFVQCAPDTYPRAFPAPTFRRSRN